MKIWGLIPARLESSRLPNKAMKLIGEYPMIVHVAKRARLCELFHGVAVCTDSREIALACAKENIAVVLTKSSHANGTERIGEAAVTLGVDGNDMVIDIQGDEPLVNPDALERLCRFFTSHEYDIVVPYNHISDGENPNRVKIVESRNRVLYMTRCPAPYHYNEDQLYKKHLSTVAFSGRALQRFCKSNMSPLEAIEGVELLRALEYGANIGTFFEETSTLAVDTTADYEEVIRLMGRDSYYGKY